MDNKETKIEDRKSYLTLDSRKKMAIDGVEEIVSFNDEQILLNTVLGSMDIRGENLKMNKLDVQNGDVMISGKISYIVYTSDEKKSRKGKGILSRLFR
ncbi:MULTISPECIES: sporulation protein YabP [unclassified Clostridium]|uniref:sporulation protein YabP n=1 Tax=unclassified Clostridium TaxID=2614128 RepID=UPI0025C096DE|nr:MULTISPECIES: sporulation protein YabP [unclassified Clostridium]